jgi:hypothetical protein
VSWARKVLASSRPRRPGAYGAEADVASCARSVTHLRDALPHVLVGSLAPAADAANLRQTSGPGHSLVGVARVLRLDVDMHPLDLRADRCQLARHVLVAALDMPRVAKHTLALGAQPGYDERGA